MTDTCRSCGARIVWGVTEKGHRMPLDPAPVPDGNLIYLDGNVRTATAEETALPKFRSHFASCPQAASHRGKKRTGKSC